MKKRIVYIIVLILLGMVCIELYLRNKTEDNYEMMDYKIIYSENTNNNEKLLFKTPYYDYYFEHYDLDSYIKYENGKKMDIIEAFNKGYIFLGDLLKEINIVKKVKFSLQVEDYNQNRLEYKTSNNRVYMYYYNLDKINVKIEETNEIKDLMNLIQDGELQLKDIVTYLESIDTDKKVNDKYEIYNPDDFILIIDTEYNCYYFGNEDLNIEIVKSINDKVN